MCPAIFVRQRFYADFAAFLARRGLRALTFTNRGMGVSLAAEPPGWTHRLRDWGEQDLPAMIAHARASYPHDRIYAVGHSMGGQLIALSDAVHSVEGIVTVASTAAWWGHWPFPENVAILAWYCAVPLIGRIVPRFPASWIGLGPDVSASLVRDWARLGRHRRYLFAPSAGLRPSMASYRGRVLAYSFADDERLGCRRAVEALHRHYIRAELTHRHIDPKELGQRRVGHFGFFRRGVGRQLWDRTIAWITRPRARKRG